MEEGEEFEREHAVLTPRTSKCDKNIEEESISIHPERCRRWLKKACRKTTTREKRARKPENAFAEKRSSWKAAGAATRGGGDGEGVPPCIVKG